MFDVGFAELFLLSLIGLLVLGPERLPAVARTLGAFMRKARNSWYNLKHSIETELEAADVSEPLKSAQRELQAVSERVSEMGREIRPPLGQGKPVEASAPADGAGESAPVDEDAADGAALPAQDAVGEDAGTDTGEGTGKP